MDIGEKLRSVYSCRRIALALGVATLVAAGQGSLSASATIPAPTITGLTATPGSLPDTGGQVTLSANVANASSCSVSVTRSVDLVPVELSGFPETVACSPVSVDVTLPANTSDTTFVYKLSLSATGTTTVTHSILVAVALQPIPTITSYGADPSTFGFSGGPTVISANVTNATSCTIAVAPTLPGFPEVVPCTSGSVSLDVTLPPQTTVLARTYKFTLAAAGSKTVKALTGAVVGGEPAPTITSWDDPAYVGEGFGGYQIVLGYLGAVLNLSATVTNAQSCTITSNLPVAGLPATVPCDDVADTISLPADFSALPKSYALKLTAVGSKTVKATLRVEVFESKRAGFPPCPPTLGPGAQLTGCVLAGANLAGVDLQNANLTDAEFAVNDLSGSNLSGATLTGALIVKCDFSNANLDGATMTGANVGVNDFSDATMTGANLSGALFQENELPGANLTGANLTNTNLDLTDLSGSVLSNVSSGGVTGTPAGLPTNWVLMDGYLVGAGANLAGANLSGAGLSGAVLPDIDLSNANLSNATLNNANLAGANLSQANLAGVILQGANLTDANLTGATLGGFANLDGANFTGAVVTGINWGSNDNECPDGTDSQSDGGTCIGHLGLTSTSPCALCLLGPSGLTLYNQGKASITVTDTTGNAGIDVDSSTQPDAQIKGGSGSITAPQINLVGTYSGSGFSPTPTTGTTPVPDPLGDVPDPTPTTTAIPTASYSCTSACGTLPANTYGNISLGGGGSLTIPPGNYSGISVIASSVLTLEAGNYFFTGPFTVGGTGGASVQEAGGVLLYFTCSSGNTIVACASGGQSGGSLSLGGTGSVDLAPQTTGTYAGLTVFYDRNNDSGMSLSATPGLSFSGTVYAKDSALALNGTIGTLGSMIIVNSATVSGSGSITINYDASENIAPPA